MRRSSVRNACEPASEGGMRSDMAYRPAMGFLAHSMVHSVFILARKPAKRPPPLVDIHIIIHDFSTVLPIEWPIPHSWQGMTMVMTVVVTMIGVWGEHGEGVWTGKKFLFRLINFSSRAIGQRKGTRQNETHSSGSKYQ